MKGRGDQPEYGKRESRREGCPGKGGRLRQQTEHCSKADQCQHAESGTGRDREQYDVKSGMHSETRNQKSEIRSQKTRHLFWFLASGFWFLTICHLDKTRSIQ